MILNAIGQRIYIYIYIYIHIYIYIYIYIYGLKNTHDLMWHIDKASEKKRNICAFNKLCVFFNPCIWSHTFKVGICFKIYKGTIKLCPQTPLLGIFLE